MGKHKKKNGKFLKIFFFIIFFAVLTFAFAVNKNEVFPCKGIVHRWYQSSKQFWKLSKSFHLFVSDIMCGRLRVVYFEIQFLVLKYFSYFFFVSCYYFFFFSLKRTFSSSSIFIHTLYNNYIWTINLRTIKKKFSCNLMGSKRGKGGREKDRTDEEQFFCCFTKVFNALSYTINFFLFFA